MMIFATQLEQTAKLLSNKLDTVAVDWKLTCDEVYITTTLDKLFNKRKTK